LQVHNAEIADAFDRLADLLEIEGANPFRVRAYRNAARTIRGYGKSMSDLIKADTNLSKLPNIGKDLAGKIKIMVETGKLPLLEEVEGRTPAALSKLMKVKGLGPKRVKALYIKLDIKSADDLKRAIRSGKIRNLEGFGEKTEQMIMARLKQFSDKEQRTRLLDAEEIIKPLLEYLKRDKGVKDIIVAGSYRRRKETIGDIDILITARQGSSIVEHFTRYEEVQETVSKGTTRSTVRLHSGLSVDLRVVPQVSYGAALHYFTGSKAHNIAVRKLGIKKGYKINEYGVFKGDNRIAGKTEKGVYAKVNLPYIPPELRENRGELELARKNKLPDLIRLKDIRGDLHCHTMATDGQHSLEQMAKAAARHGHDCLSINDHSKHVTVAHGLNKKHLLEQIRAIDKLNEKLNEIVILKSVELDILEDGTLDLPDSVLKQLDFTVCAIHYKFDLPRIKQTKRILRAMDNPYFNILAHPSGRLINERDTCSIDLEKIIQGALDRGCYLEVNSQPDRMDLTDEACKLAKDMGVKVAITSDAHRTSDLELIRFGVDQARRGWLEKDDVINTQSLKKLKSLLKRK